MLRISSIFFTAYKFPNMSTYISIIEINILTYPSIPSSDPNPKLDLSCLSLSHVPMGLRDSLLSVEFLVLLLCVATKAATKPTGALPGNKFCFLHKFLAFHPSFLTYMYAYEEAFTISQPPHPSLAFVFCSPSPSLSDRKSETKQCTSQDRLALDPSLASIHPPLKSFSCRFESRRSLILVLKNGKHFLVAITQRSARWLITVSYRNLNQAPHPVQIPQRLLHPIGIQPQLQTQRPVELHLPDLIRHG
jgi:hypothetical protein